MRMEPLVDPVLRITRDGLLLEDSMLATDPALVAMGAPVGADERGAYAEDLLQELDTDLIDDLEDMPEVSDADLM
jgi:hypothetical protein